MEEASGRRHPTASRNRRPASTIAPVRPPGARGRCRAQMLQAARYSSAKSRAEIASIELRISRSKAQRMGGGVAVDDERGAGQRCRPSGHSFRRLRVSSRTAAVAIEHLDIGHVMAESPAVPPAYGVKPGMMVAVCFSAWANSAFCSDSRPASACCRYPAQCATPSSCIALAGLRHAWPGRVVVLPYLCAWRALLRCSVSAWLVEMPLPPARPSCRAAPAPPAAAITGGHRGGGHLWPACRKTGFRRRRPALGSLPWRPMAADLTARPGMRAAPPKSRLRR